MDSIVDSQFSEPVRLIPWTGGQSISDGGHQDPTRKVLDTVGIYVTPGSSAMGEGGTLASGLTTQIQVSREWISITEENMGDPSLWVRYDRVFLPDQLPNQQYHTIESVVPSATKRYNVNLIRLQQGTP
jgi:hypothetical protein